MTYINQTDVENGFSNLPKITKITQALLRKRGVLKYIKVGKYIVYKKEWIEEYLESLEKKQGAKQ